MDSRERNDVGAAISKAYTSDEATSYEEMRQKVFAKMSMFSQATHGICEYEIVYDKDKNDIKVVKHIGELEKDKMYFKSQSDAYACILTAGESNIKKYYFGRRSNK